MWTIPNILTFFRLLLLPIIIGLFYVPENWALWLCLALYILGALTDFVDGWVARRFDQMSEFGKFLDPIADKIFVVSILLMLVSIDHVHGLWTICVVIILMREFIIAGLREYLAPQGIRLPVTGLAKWKTATQMTAIGFLIVIPVLPYGEMIGHYLLIAATILTIITGWIYLKSGLRYFSK